GARTLARRGEEGSCHEVAAMSLWTGFSGILRQSLIDAHQFDKPVAVTPQIGMIFLRQFTEPALDLPGLGIGREPEQRQQLRVMDVGRREAAFLPALEVDPIKIFLEDLFHAMVVQAEQPREGVFDRGLVLSLRREEGVPDEPAVLTRGLALEPHSDFELFEFSQFVFQLVRGVIHLQSTAQAGKASDVSYGLLPGWCPGGLLKALVLRLVSRVLGEPFFHRLVNHLVAELRLPEGAVMPRVVLGIKALQET